MLTYLFVSWNFCRLWIQEPWVKHVVRLSHLKAALTRTATWLHLLLCLQLRRLPPCVCLCWHCFCVLVFLYAAKLFLYLLYILEIIHSSWSWWGTMRPKVIGVGDFSSFFSSISLSSGWWSTPPLFFLLLSSSFCLYFPTRNIPHTPHFNEES